MAEPNHEVERFAFVRGDAIPDDTGGWVHYSDWEAMKEERDKARSDVTAIRHKTVARLCQGRDQAKAQALAEVREALTSDAVRAACEAALDGSDALSPGWGYYPLDGLVETVIQTALSTLEDTQGDDTERRAEATPNVASPKPPESTQGEADRGR